MRGMICWLLVLTAGLFCLATPVLAADTVCLQCHGELPDKLGAPVGNWRDSVHAVNGISCHDCHGGDPADQVMAMSPERGFLGVPEPEDIPAFCGRCHVGVFETYRDGAHGQALAAGRGPQCVTCHGNHAVKVAVIDLINEQDCSRCHSYERAALIRLSLVETDTMISKVDGDFSRLHRLGFAVDDMRGELFDLRNRFRRVFHEVDVAKLRRETGGIQTEIGTLQQKIASIDETLGERKLWGSLAIGLFILAGVICLLARKTYEEEEKR